MGTNNRLEVKSKTIELVYREYLNQDYSVNRRYQRKLVWTTDEKQRLIDSILHEYPLPQFLVAEADSDDYRYEIIDGMQRLNAIVGFIENEFHLESGEYFDLEATASTKKLLDEGKLEQKYPKLSRSKSLTVATYELAQSVYRTSDNSSVEEVFRRINSSGQKLSMQDLRQAGSISPISDVVRKISSSIRGDSSPSDILPLSDMKVISISNTSETEYGIDVDKVFWVQRGVLDRTSVRSSSDEQLVLDIVSDMLFNPVLSTSTPVRNGLFQTAAPRLPQEVAEKIRLELEDPGWDSGTKQSDLIRRYMEVHNRVERILNAIPSGATFKSHIGLTGTNPVPRYFESVFSAVYRIMYKNGNDLSSAENAAELLKGAHLKETMPSGGGEWTAQKKEEIISGLVSSLQHAFGLSFEEGKIGADGTLSISGSEFSNLINGALLETSTRDMKQGLLPLSKKERTLNNGAFLSIMKTLSAISNSHPKKGGHIVVGIVDSDADAQRVADIDGTDTVTHRSLKIVGVTREAHALGMDINKYWDTVMRKIKDFQKLPEQYRLNIVKQSKIAAYGGGESEPMHVLILVAPSIETPVAFDGKYYTRIGTETEEVRDDVTFGMRFQEQIARV